MNVIEFKASNNNTVFCLVDNTHKYKSWACEISKNLADFTISNLNAKDYTVLQGFSEEVLLQKACNLGYRHAVVFSTGTEFINGFEFFNQLELLVNKDFFLCGHVLDRGDAYYELHDQCYVVNLQTYKKLKYPVIGQQELGVRHSQEVPWRSQDNWHDNYTPKTVSGGDRIKDYNHKCHGWHILKIAFEKDLNVLVFDEHIRNNKRHHYPESQKDFNKNLEWIYFRERYCANEFVHDKNTEWHNPVPQQTDLLIAPASGTLYFETLAPNATVVFYDYNIRALEYWEKHAPKGFNYKFVLADLLTENCLIDYIEDGNTVVNLSNIFCYEGTAALTPLSYRLEKENQLVKQIKAKCPNAYINFTLRASRAFASTKLCSYAKDMDVVELRDLVKPTWHYNQDWI
jgi:hypothetical protein